MKTYLKNGNSKKKKKKPIENGGWTSRVCIYTQVATIGGKQEPWKSKTKPEMDFG